MSGTPPELNGAVFVSFLDDIEEIQTEAQQGGRLCPLCLLVDEKTTTLQPKKDAAELVGVLADPEVYARTIVAVLARRGIKLGVHSVQRHRREHVEGWEYRR